MGEVQYPVEFAWACAWSNGSPQPFILCFTTRGQRKDAIAAFIDLWDHGSGDVMRSWRRAYRKGATLVVASMQYSGIVFAVMFSLVLFGDQIAPMGWIGIAVIVASGVLATILRSRAMPNTPAEEH